MGTPRSGLKAALQAGESAVEGNRRGFEAGLRINSEVLNAEQQLYATMRDLMKAHVDRLCSNSA